MRSRRELTFVNFVEWQIVVAVILLLGFGSLIMYQHVENARKMARRTQCRNSLRAFNLIRCVTFSPDGVWLASAADDSTVRLWDVDSGVELAILRGHETSVNCVAFHPNGKVLASADWDGTIKLWDMASKKEKLSWKAAKRHIISLIVSPDGKRLASADAEGSIKMWNLSNGKMLTEIKGHRTRVMNIEFSPDGSRLLSNHGDEAIRLWDVSSGRQLMVIRPTSGRIGKNVTFSPDGKRLAYAVDSEIIEIRDAFTGKILKRCKGFPAQAGKLFFSSDGTRLISVDWRDYVNFWDASTGEHLEEFTLKHGSPSCLAISPDRKHLATGGYDLTIRVLELSTQKLQAELRGHERVEIPFWKQNDDSQVVNSDSQTEQNEEQSLSAAVLSKK